MPGPAAATPSSSWSVSVRVLALLHAYAPAHSAGAELTAHALLRHLVACGHEATVSLSRQTGEPYVLDGVRVEPYVSKRDPFRWIPGGCDVLLTHLENTPRASALGQLNGLPVCHLLHNTFEPSKNWLHRQAPALAVFNSRWMAEDYQRFGWSGRSVVVHPPVWASEYRTTPGDMVTLINAFANKGPDVVWALAARTPDVKFLIVKGGYGTQDLRELPNVEVLEHVPAGEMAERVYSRTRILLMPSRYESYGRAAVEAMCSGIPVIAHPTPGLRESLGDAGVFIDRADLDGWEQAVRRLLDGRRWRAASRRATKRAAELDPTSELETFRAALEQTVSHWPKVVSR